MDRQGFQAKGAARAEAREREGQGQGVGSAVCEGTGEGLRRVRWAGTRRSKPLGPAKNSGIDFQSNEHPLKGLT